MIGGPCPECGDELAPDQRYCISCGHRVASPLAPSYMPGSVDGFGERGEVRRGFPMPIPVAGLIAAATLGFGVVMGTAISPNLSSLVAGERVEGPTVVQAPPDKKPDRSSKSKGGGGGSGGGGSTSIPGFGGSTGGFFGDTGSFGGGGTGGGGTGGKGKPKPKPKPKPEYTFISGTVVHKNPVAGSYSISSGGSLSAIHAKTLPSFGAKVKVPIRVLANGTFAEVAGRQNKGQATAVRFTGVVTDSRDGLLPGDPDIYTVSGRGASVLVFAEDASGVTPSPLVGSLITNDVQFRSASAPVTFPPPAPPGPCAGSGSFPNPPLFPGKQLWQAGSPTVVPTPVTSAVIETVTQWTCAGRAVVSSDDIHYSQSNLDLPTSAAVDPNRLPVGEALMASVTIAGGAVTEITGARSDDGSAGADSSSTGQGTLARVASIAQVARVARATDLKIAKVAAREARR